MTSTEKNASLNLPHCPLCGDKVSVYKDYTDYWLVQCDFCGISTLKKDNIETVILDWNRRKK